MIKSWPDLIDLFGGPAKLADALGITTEHAVQMRRRRSIPTRYWGTLIEAADERGIAGINKAMLAEIAILSAEEERAA